MQRVGLACVLVSACCKHRCYAACTTQVGAAMQLEPARGWLQTPCIWRRRSAVCAENAHG